MGSISPLEAVRFGRQYRRPRPWAVRNVSFSLPAGSITALVGPNGSGKSTLIRACLGFERPDEGRVVVLGVDPRRDRARAVVSIGYVPQGASLYRSLTVGEHLAMARAARPLFDARSAERRLSGLRLAMKRSVRDLSGGEQAQLALVLALGSQAPLLLLDEPLASLDPLARRDFLNVLTTDCRERGATVLLSSHIVTDVEQACDRIMVLADGKLVLDGPVASAISQFRILSTGPISKTDAIGSFAAPDGEILTLVAGAAGGRPPSLEEIVLGHLASGRPTTEGPT